MRSQDSLSVVYLRALYEHVSAMGHPSVHLLVAPCGVFFSEKYAMFPMDETDLHGEFTSQLMMSVSWLHLAMIMGVDSADLAQCPRTYECAWWKGSTPSCARMETMFPRMPESTISLTFE